MRRTLAEPGSNRRGPLAGASLALRAAVLSALLALAGCATAPPPPSAQPLLHDDWFAPPSPPVAGLDMLAASPAMGQFAQQARANAAHGRDLRLVLIEALYRPDQLQLRYDSSMTRTAAQAFEARAGNCLSLVLMTAALAGQLGLPVTFQSVVGEDSYSRDGALVFASGHVNLVLGRPRTLSEHLTHDTERELTVDFLPGQQLKGQRVQPLTEATVRAMFLNNRAAEALAAGQASQAYWWAREAVLADPGFTPGLNTLGVIYLREGRLGAAEQALRQALLLDPRRPSTLVNLLRTAERAGRGDDARLLAARLAALQPHPPFEQLDRGREALVDGQLAKARELFAAELRQQPYQPEAHYWMAVAQHGLGDERRAVSHLEKAVEYSSTRAGHDLYAAKLAQLRAQGGAR